MSERHVSRIVVDLLLERRNSATGKTEILMMLAEYLDNQYDLPGGHLESGEDLYDAMIREAKEELGIEIEREEMQMVHIYHHFEKDMLKFVFRVKKFKNEIQNLEPEKCKFSMSTHFNSLHFSGSKFCISFLNFLTLKTNFNMSFSK